MTKKIIAAILMLSIISFGTIFNVGAAEDIDSLESQLASLKEEDAKYQEILNKTKDDISKKEAYSDALVKKINVLGEQLSLNHNKSDELDTKISQLQKDIDSANEGITTQIETLKGRLKTIYMAGGASDLEIILGAKDFSDFLDKLELVKTLSAYDSNLINEIKEKLKGITENKEELEANKQELKQVEQDLESDQAEQSLLDENQDLLNNLYSKSDLLIANIETSSSELSDVERQIQEYYAKQKAEQEAAQQSQSSSENSSQSSSDDNYDDDASSDSSSGDSSGGSSGGSSGDSGYTPPSSSGGYVWPCPGFYYLSSEWNEDRYTYNHGAIDIAGGGIMGATVVAADSGTVISSNSSCVHNWGKSGSCGCGGGYGNYVWIDHGNGKATVYAHLSSVSVSTGQYVSQGQVLGYVGSTGESTGPHLHFECRYYGEKYNPMTEF